jgi:hypothetical protein
MLRKVLGVAVVVCVCGLASAQTKDKDKKDAKKDAGKGTKATVVAVDQDKKTLTLQIDGKKETFTVGKDVKFFGPQGGKKTGGLKDDRLKVGAEVRVVRSGKDLKEVYLPYRKAAKPKDKDKGKDKDKK